MTLTQIILLPFTVLYALITSLRNWLYEKGYKKSVSFPLPVISVGNLTVGGTGKTPHIEYLIRLLKNTYKIATLSRGYGRQTKGFIMAGAGTEAGQIGDEPMQFYRKYGSQISVAVGEKRVLAIPQILKQQPYTQVILLDDAFQHRAVKPALSILLTDYNRLFYEDYVLPSGRLREPRIGAKRADIVIVSKCPDELSLLYRTQITKEIQAYTRPGTPVFFTGIRYSQPVPFIAASGFSSTVLLVSGLANPAPFEKYASSTYQVKEHLAFSDHHFYTSKDMERIGKIYRQVGAQAILTTEKDYVKLSHRQFAYFVAQMPFFYLPIEVNFLFGEAAAFNKNLWKGLSLQNNINY